MRDDEYFAIKNRAAKIFMSFDGVNAVGLGSKEINGEPTGEIAIKVYLSPKKPLNDVPKDQRIPETFEDVPTDVIVMGPATPDLTPGVTNPSSMTSDSSDPRPSGALQGGLKIRRELGTGYGTMGCFLVDKNDSSAVYALTNHHVVANTEGKVSFSYRVGQPSVPTGMPASTSLGVITAAGRSSTRDAAIIRLKPGTPWLAEIKEIGIVQGQHNITLAECVSGTYEVRKRGAKTGLTGGIVSAIGAVHGSNPSSFSNAIIIEPNPDPAHPGDPTFFSWPGDSGSVYVNSSMEIVALHSSSWARTPTSPHHGKSIGLPIADVLRNFKEIDKYDLEVATATTAGTVNTVLQPAGSLDRTPPFIDENGDHDYYRPLQGGSQMLAHPMLGNYNAGTLGCLIKHATQANTAYLLTSHGMISQGDSLTPTTDTNLGQPDNSESASGCCSNRIGHFAVGSISTTRDAALGKLKEGMKWVAEILEIGYIKDIYTLTAANVSSGSFNVRKRGVASRLTGGVVTAIGGVHGTLPSGVNANAMLIRPNPNPSFPGARIYFSFFSDRGSAVVDKENRVVGLLYDEIEEPTGSGVTYGVAMPIQTVIDQFSSEDSLVVVVATATTVDQVKTTSASRVMNPELTNVTKPVIKTPEPIIIPPNGTLEPMGIGAFARVRDDLRNSETGQWILEFHKNHMDEISNLITSNRRVATVWHRSGGPALLQAFVRSFQHPNRMIPKIVNGHPVATCLEQLAIIFKKYGSDLLRFDINILEHALPDIGGLSYGELIQKSTINADTILIAGGKKSANKGLIHG